MVSAHQLLEYEVYSVCILNREGQGGPTPACRNKQSCVIVKTCTCEVEYEFLNSGFNCFFFLGNKQANKTKDTTVRWYILSIHSYKVKLSICSLQVTWMPRENHDYPNIRYRKVAMELSLSLSELGLTLDII